MPKSVRGSTAEAGSAILGAGFWKPGTKLTGIYVRGFSTNLGDGKVGECSQFLCAIPQTIKIPVDARGRIDFKNGKETEIDKFSVGALAGIEMALDVARSNAPWFTGFQRHDKVTFECVGVQEGQNGNSDMPEFVIEIER